MRPCTLLLTLSACLPALPDAVDTDAGVDTDTGAPVDADSDGFDADADCDDADAAVNPDAEEVCDEVDNDCDEQVDEDVAPTWYRDVDEDGYGDAGSTVEACQAPAGFVSDASDCDDASTTVHPAAIEVPHDGVDQDCNGRDVCDDIDCDGWPDLVFANAWDGSSSAIDSTVFYGGAVPDAIADDSLAGVAPYDLAAGDFNGDGWKDIALGTYPGVADSYVYWGSASGYSDGERTALPTNWVYGVSAGDLDLDGYDDVVFAAGGDSNDPYTYYDAYIYWGSAAGLSTAERTVLPSMHDAEVALGDLDGDGLLDVAMGGSRNYEYDVYTYIFYSRSGWASPTSFLVDYSVSDVEIGDLDHDGSPDLILSDDPSEVSGDETLVIRWGPSLTSWTTIEVPDAYRTALGDFNGDGNVDMATESESGATSGSCVVWGDGTRAVSAGLTCLSTLVAFDVAAGDLNLDGYDDLVYANARDDDDYTVNSTVYWGSADGIVESDASSYPTTGAHAVLIVGAPDALTAQPAWAAR